jgi:hypothetical protein
MDVHVRISFRNAVIDRYNILRMVKNTNAGPFVASPASSKETADSAVNLTSVVARRSKSMAGAKMAAFLDVLMSEGDGRKVWRCTRHRTRLDSNDGLTAEQCNVVFCFAGTRQKACNSPNQTSAQHARPRSTPSGRQGQRQRQRKDVKQVRHSWHTEHCCD